jgi:replicative DNA helicase
VIVDYLQLVATESPGSVSLDEDQPQDLSAVSRGLKAMAKELNCPVVALSQLSKPPMGRTGNACPQLSDLHQYGSVEEDADVEAFIFREEVYRCDDPALHGKAEIIVAKQRNGPTGTVNLTFIKMSTRFENSSQDSGPDE